MGDKTVENDCTNHPSSTESDSLLQWSMWQLIDSILPTGGFAHSFGLEAATQSHIVSHPEDLQTYVIHVLENTGSLLLPFVYTATTSPDLQTWQQLDMILDATLTWPSNLRKPLVDKPMPSVSPAINPVDMP
nr:urease accessory protein F [Tanacetum cinerariifolium]